MSSYLSVLMPVYNAEDYLNQSIESILNQTFRDFEFLIINDGSTDQSEKVIRDYAQKDPRIRLVNNPENLGLVRTLNKGLQLAQGKYIARQDGDDISSVDRFEKQIQCLDSFPDVVLVASEFEMINSQGEVIGKTNRFTQPELVPWFLLFYNHVGGHSQVMYRKDIVLSINGYSDEYLHCEDYELWLRLAQKDKIVILPDILMKYRVHQESVSSHNSVIQKNTSLEVSMRAIKNLIDKDVTLAEMTDLRNFWLRINLTNASDFQRINKNLKKIYKGFIENYKNNKNHVLVPEISREICLIINQYLIDWFSILKLQPKKNSLKILKIFIYSWDWNFKNSWIFILKKIYKSIDNLLKYLTKLPKNNSIIREDNEQDQEKYKS